MSDSPQKKFPEQEEQYPAREEEQQEQPVRKQPGEGGPKSPDQKY